MAPKPSSSAPSNNSSNPIPPPRFTLNDDDTDRIERLDQFVELDESSDYIQTVSNDSTSNHAARSASTQRPAHAQRPSLNDNASPTADKHVFQRMLRRYPSLDPDTLQALLISCNNDIDRANALIEGDTNASTVSDAALATTMQASGSVSSLQRRRGRTTSAVFPMEAQALHDLVSTLKHIVVPALHAHFEELTLSDTAGETASIAYSLHKLEITSLSLTNVTVRPAADRLSIFLNIVNAQLEINVGKWNYRGVGIVPIKDEGHAKLSVGGLNLALVLQARSSHSGLSKAMVRSCDVTVDGTTRFKTYGGKADWAYNAIAVFLKPLVLSYVKDVVSDAVSNALSFHLVQWSSSRSKDSCTNAAATTGTSPQHVTATE